MNEIDREEYLNENTSPSAAVSADEREFYRLSDDTFGVIGTYRNGDRVEVRGLVLRPAVPFDGQARVDESKSESGRVGDGEERARTKVEEWLQGK